MRGEQVYASSGLLNVGAEDARADGTLGKGKDVFFTGYIKGS